jgi:hypothetical protein
MINQLYIVIRNERYITGVSKKNGKQELSSRVPCLKDADKFWKLLNPGKALRERHSLENPKVNEYIIDYQSDGDNIFGKPNFVKQPVIEALEVTVGNIFINETYYFSNIPQETWNFYIESNHPVQKWFKDRKDRELSHDDILHNQNISVALT